jgi:hypothetical protein
MLPFQPVKTVPKPLKKRIEAGDPAAFEAAQKLAEGERKIHSLDEIETWKGLSKGEREILRALRRHVRARTSMKGPKGWTSATHKQIANWADYETKQARRHIKSLTDKKVLEVIGDKKVAGQKQNKGPGARRGYAIIKKGCCFVEVKP